MEVITSADQIDKMKLTDMVQFKCVFCGSLFNRDKKQWQRATREFPSTRCCYCSDICRVKHQDKHVELNCANCDILFTKLKSQLSDSGNDFCSKSCSASYNNKVSPKRQPQGTCTKCGGITNKRRNICYKCSPKLFKEHIVYEDIDLRHKQEIKCLFCGVVLISSNNQTKYCSHAHRHAYIRHLKYEEAISQGYFNSDVTARKYLIETYGYKCMICGIDEWTGQRLPVVMDHINGNSEDRSISNLRIICPNCDALTPTFKSKNKGKGRAYRRQRYAEGKSY